MARLSATATYCAHPLSEKSARNPYSLSPRLQPHSALVSATRRGAMAPAALLPLAPLPHHPNPPRRPLCRCGASRRGFTVHTVIAIASASDSASAPTAAADATSPSPPPSQPTQTPSSKPGPPALGGIANTRSWSQYYGSGFSIRVPPSFDDILEPDVITDLNCFFTPTFHRPPAVRVAGRRGGAEELSVWFRI